MKAFKIHHKKIRISSKDCFLMWLELKSFNKVALHLAGIGDINPNTGKPFSIQTIADYIYRYVVEFPEETKPMIEEKFYGGEIPQEQFDRWLIKAAMDVYNTSWARQKDWIIRHKMEKYKDIWDGFSPTGTLD